MPSDLSEPDIFILNILCSGRCLSSSHSKNSEQIRNYYAKKEFDKDYDDAIRTLLNEGYITKVRKNDDKYYISDIPKTFKILSIHGIEVSKGKKRTIK